ncbi:MAG: hypothetical protein ABIW84_05785, partial [Ilumatobacteraceae bacterium]
MSVVEESAPTDRTALDAARRRRSSVAVAYAPILITAALLALVPLRYGDTGSTMSVVTDGM